MAGTGIKYPASVGLRKLHLVLPLAQALHQVVVVVEADLLRLLQAQNLHVLAQKVHLQALRQVHHRLDLVPVPVRLLLVEALVVVEALAVLLQPQQKNMNH